MMHRRSLGMAAVLLAASAPRAQSSGYQMERPMPREPQRAPVNRRSGEPYQQSERRKARRRAQLARVTRGQP
jgi:hypothetical protein